MIFYVSKLPDSFLSSSKDDLRNGAPSYAPNTLNHYLCHVKLLEKHTGKSALEITSDELKQYLHDCIKSGIGYSSINISCDAFKLFFNKIHGYNWSNDVIIRPRRPKSLPHVLSQDEILSITDQVQNLKHKTILLTTYSSGLRISETLNLRISDIDSVAMLIRVNHGKGNKDRLTILSHENLKMPTCVIEDLIIFLLT